MSVFKKYFSKNRFGATSIFLAIIISSIVFVECTYLIIVANLDRRLTYTRAVNKQIDYYLSQYDRELYRMYGIYAFENDSFDLYVFNEILSSNGLTNESVITVSGIDEFTTDDLREVISVYYSYRSSSIIFNSVKEEISRLIEEIDTYGVVEKIQEFASSVGEPILRDILNGVSNIADLAETIADVDESKSIAGHLTDLLRIINEYKHISPTVSSQYRSEDVTSIVDVIEFIDSGFNSYSDVISDYVFHPFCAHYATYNFDSRLVNESSINGSSFDMLHEENISDVEYILTGLEGNSGETLTAFMIYQLLCVKELVNCYMDEELRSYFLAIGTVLSTVLGVLTDGVLALTPDIYEAIIIVLYSAICASNDLEDLIQGDKVSLFSYGEYINLDFGYKDFVCVFMNLVPDNLMLSRMNSIFERDLASYHFGAQASIELPFYSIETERMYEIYA